MILAFGDLTLDTGSRVLGCHGRTVIISRQAGNIAAALLQAQGRNLTHDRLVWILWNGRDDGPQESALGVVIHRLRRFLVAIGSNTQVTSLWGAGYALTSCDEPDVTLRLTAREYRALLPQLEELRACEDA